MGSYSLKKKAAEQRSQFRFTLPGQRIARSVVSVWLCILIYHLRGDRGEPFYSVIAALQCVQPYSSNMLQEGRSRIIGTLIGAFWGAVVVFSDLLPIGGSFETHVLHYFLLGLLTGLVIYSTVVFGLSQYALFSAVVFLGIAMYHIEDANPYLHIFNRTMDTIIGVLVAIGINSVHLPRVRDRSTLFISGIDDVLFREDRKLSRYTTVELNRFLNDGMRFSVSTRQTPATVREILAGIDLRLPIIAMDGAVLYNIKTMQYVRTEKMDPDVVLQVTDFLQREGMPFFTNTIHDNLLVIYFRDYKDLILEEVRDIGSHTPAHDGPQELPVTRSAYLAMAKLYRKKRVSPIRNYVRTNALITEDVVYISMIDREENIDRLHDKLIAQPWADRCRTNFDYFDCGEGEKLMRILSPNATRARMNEYLQTLAGAPEVVTFGSEEGISDVFIDDPGHDRMVRELKKRFAPVDLRGWKNILHM